ncbi:MAG: 16S rRNA (uracil(1498)-N(3))-methyltransferase [Clostridia bacterium]|nr:16S rRNA (uracil(1498)-N(3))-methyltransferase [Clostridia bacterium]
MPRFFVSSDGIEENTIKIKGDDAFHIARSLRMAEGDAITVCDMHGREHSCTLTRIRDDECECLILETREGNTEPPVHITLYMAYPKGDKLETVVQKAVELGASRIVPFESSRCIKRPKAEKAEKNTARLTRIAEEAAKQCGRSRLPEICPPTDFGGMLADAARAELALFCYEGDGTLSIKDILKEEKIPESIAVIVGCEGGFSLDEAEAARAAGCRLTGLGVRILRCETAPTYALTAISYRYEL